MDIVAPAQTVAETEPQPQPEPQPQTRHSMLNLVRELTQEIRMFFRQEIQLAKTELSEKLKTLTRNGLALAIGGVAAYAGLIVFLIGLGFLLSWAFFLAGLQAIFASFLGLAVIGLLTITLGGVLVLKGINTLSKESMAPQRTLHTLQELRQGEPALAGQPSGAARPSSAEMQTRVEATEQRMSETLDELGHRLSPGYMSEQVKHRIQENPFRSSLFAMAAGVVSGLLLRRRFRNGS